MAKQKDNTIRNNTIAGLLVAMILGISSYFIPIVQKFFVYIWDLVLLSLAKLNSSYQLSGWVIVILSLLSITLVILLIASFFQNKSTNSSSYLNYTSDKMFGVNWEWNWIKGNIRNLVSYCPSCLGQILYDESSCRRYSHESPQTKLICENCNHSIIGSIKGGNSYYAKERIKREILRRLRVAESNQGNEYPLHHRHSSPIHNLVVIFSDLQWNSKNELTTFSYLSC